MRSGQRTGHCKKQLFGLVKFQHGRGCGQSFLRKLGMLSAARQPGLTSTARPSGTAPPRDRCDPNPPAPRRLRQLRYNKSPFHSNAISQSRLRLAAVTERHQLISAPLSNEMHHDMISSSSSVYGLKMQWTPEHSQWAEQHFDISSTTRSPAHKAEAYRAVPGHLQRSAAYQYAWANDDISCPHRVQPAQEVRREVLWHPGDAGLVLRAARRSWSDERA
ncbi:Fidgetin [Oryzias melastigma]|uniref:Fidgetin n=1 Tax=Oryzias melastigma TaxID=30732 RepID=A0A834C7B9_ORYME|nr:Fidgetin [Oryzias melastigma]